MLYPNPVKASVATSCPPSHKNGCRVNGALAVSLLSLIPRFSSLSAGASPWCSAHLHITPSWTYLTSCARTTCWAEPWKTKKRRNQSAISATPRWRRYSTVTLSPLCTQSPRTLLVPVGGNNENWLVGQLDSGGGGGGVKSPTRFWHLTQIFIIYFQSSLKQKSKTSTYLSPNYIGTWEVINFQYPLQPHQKYYQYGNITQFEEPGVSWLTQVMMLPILTTSLMSLMHSCQG